MIQLYGGTDTYESYRHAKKQAQEIAETSNAVFAIHDADETGDIVTILQDAESIGLFQNTNTLLIKRIFVAKKHVDYLVDNFDYYNQFDIVLWHDAKPDGKLKLTKRLKKEKQLFLYESPKSWELEKWVLAIAEAKKITLTKEQAHYLVTRVGTDKYQLVSTLQKIYLYQQGNKSKITTETLSHIIGGDARGDIWALLDAFGEKKSQKAREELEKMISFEQNEHYIIAMLEREINLMHKIKTVETYGGSFKDLKMHPFVLQKAQKKAKNFSMQELQFLARSLMHIDSISKKYPVKTTLLLDLFLMQHELDQAA